MGVKTLPLLFLGNVRNQRFLYVFWREIREKERERERERIYLEKCSKNPKFSCLFIYFLFFSPRGSWAVYSKKMTLRLPVAL